MVGDLVSVLRFNATDTSEFLGHFGNGLVGDVDKIIFFLNNLAVLRVLLWITANDHAYFMPGVQSSLVILEGDGQVLFSLFVRPCDDGFALAVEAYPLLDDFILKEIMKPILFTNEHHLVKALRLILNTKVSGAKIMPPAITIQLVELGAELICWFPAKLNDSVIKSYLLINLPHNRNVFIEELTLISQKVVLKIKAGIIVNVIQVLFFSLVCLSVLLIKFVGLVVD